VLLAALPPTANNQQLALASYEALPVGRVQTAGERRGAIGDQRSPIDTHKVHNCVNKEML